MAGIITALAGLALLPSSVFVHASFDWPLRFATRAVTNRLVLVEMDTSACAELQQTRERWDRALHAGLLDYLREDGCPLVVFDIWFNKERQPGSDRALAEAMRQHGRVALIAMLANPSHPRMAGNQVYPPLSLFREAATNWGVAQATWETDGVVRRQWLSSEPELYPSLPWVAARLAGAPSEDPLAISSGARWLRYYGQEGAWMRLSYHFATNQAPGFFRDKMVFVGNRPKTSVPDGEDDEFRTPYTRWTGQSAGGLEIMATAFLNLVNGDGLRRLSWWWEALVLVATGALAGAGLSLLRWPVALTLGLTAAAVVASAGIGLSHFTNWWFPWLVVAGGQVPCAVAWTIASRWERAGISQYETLSKPFGTGAYGEVFLARHKKRGDWYALKKVQRSRFTNTEAYEREFHGLAQYLPVSAGDPGLLKIHHLERSEQEGYFSYVMELGDSETAGWEERPEEYRAINLENKRRRHEKNRLPLRDCVRIGIALADALHFLHQQGLIHRDIKPSNIIFVDGQPKLADVGLVTGIEQAGQAVSQIGTFDYMPPEGPGKPQADIYALGMVLYSISTGGNPSRALRLSPTLVESIPEFMFLNKVLWKACAQQPEDRHATGAELRDALKEVDRLMRKESPTHEV